MADLPPDPEDDGDSSEDTGVRSDRGLTTGTPRWVKVFGIIALLVVLLFAILLLTGGPHGPGRHTGGSPSMRVHTPSDGLGRTS